MSITDFPPPARSDARAARIVFHELESSSWRLCDLSFPPSTPEHVVAYVERRGGAFDVVWLRGARESEEFASRAEVLSAARRRTDDQSSGATRPIPIPHYRPRTR